MKTARILTILVLALGLILSWPEVSEAAPLGTAFTYQGFLAEDGKIVNGTYDLQFQLFDAPTDGNQVGDTLNQDNFEVEDGHIALALDFGNDVFTGDRRWLQISIRKSAVGGPYTDLAPRLELTLTPYTLYALSAESAEDANTVDGHDANAFAASVHNHDGSDITSGIVDEAYIDEDITRDSELASGLAGKADVGHAHDDRYYTETELQTSGSANVHWDNLSNVPDVGGVPSGVIVMWSGNIVDIPDGWVLCDGTNGTPDLTSRFIRSVLNASTDPGSIGGSSTHTHGAGSYTASSHTHSAPSGTHIHSFRAVVSNAGGIDPAWSETESSAPGTGTIGDAGTGAVTGTSASASSLPPYYALAYIMRLP